MKNFSACDKIVSKMAKTESTPVEKLFGSKTRAKLLRLFFESPSKSYYVREITRVIDEQINSVRRELLNLEGIGVIKSETYDNKVYYSANQKHPFSKPLNEMFNIIIDARSGEKIKRDKWDDYTRPIKRYLSAEMVEKKMGRPVNYVILSEDDFVYRQSVKDVFLQDIFMMEISDVIDPGKIITMKKKK